MHFSYIPPAAPPVPEAPDLSPLNALPPASLPNPTSPARLFLPLLLESAKAQGGFPSWLGDWWANWTSRPGGIPGHSLYSNKPPTGITSIGEDEETGGTLVKGSGAGMANLAALAGGGRVWVVKGRQWTEVCIRVGKS
jgi:hypothetical protein